MKVCFFFLLVLFLTGMTHIAHSQIKDASDEIANALRTGSANALAKYFNSSIEIVIPDKDEVYSKEQAETIISDFFSKNKPAGFTLQHKGGPEDARFVVGTMNTAAGKYRIYFLLKKKNEYQLINLFRIEKEIE
ncbi:MAG: DUF4783 domain-containing protein [Bacteroidia bacterium]|nr:DUF4783 domain-containing protein [Bacteroidia bacterium]